MTAPLPMMSLLMVHNGEPRHTARKIYAAMAPCPAPLVCSDVADGVTPPMPRVVTIAARRRRAAGRSAANALDDRSGEDLPEFYAPLVE